MNSAQILKYKNVDINNILIDDVNIKYNNNIFYIQSPIFNTFELLKYNDHKYIQIKCDPNKNTHLFFFKLIESIEFKIIHCLNKNIKSHITTNIQNDKLLTFIISNDTLYFDHNKNNITFLSSNKISLLFNFTLDKSNYMLSILQILQL